MIKNREYLGFLDCLVENVPLTVGMPNTVKLKYTVGKYGIDDGGYIYFVRRGVTDWQEINLTEKTALGYTTIYTNADVKLSVDTVDFVRPYDIAIRVRIRDGCLIEGDVVELTIGDTSEGSPGSIVQTIAEKNHIIFVAIDSTGSSKYVDIGSPVFLDIKNGIASDFHIVMPSNIAINENFNFNIRIIDDYGNRCEDFLGDVELYDFDGLELPKTISFSKEDRGCKKLEGKALKLGIYRVRARLLPYDLTTVSNPCIVKETCENKLFWGDMHAQNAIASGIGSMDDAFSFSKEVGVLDFTGWQGNDFEISENNWDTVKEAVKKYNKDHEFSVFLGYEWSGITGNGGDHNIYFLGDEGKVHRSGQWLYKDNNCILPIGRDDDGSDCNPISKLWEKFEDRKDVIAIPHVGGRYGNFDFYNPDFTKVIEIYSHHGVFEWYIEEAVKRRMKVGFLAASDDHTSRVGLSYPMGINSGDIGATFDVISGLTGLYAKELTRKGIWEALNQRKCYAATSSRMVLEYSCNGHDMGEEFDTSEKPVLDIKINGSAPLSHIDIYRDLELIKREYLGTCEQEESASKKIKIVWSGVRTKFRKKSVTWDGSIFVSGGMIKNAENYSIDNPFEGIKGYNHHTLNFKSKTSGDEDGVILEIIPQKGKTCEITFASKQGNFTLNIDELEKDYKTIDMGGLNCKVEISMLRRKKDQLDTHITIQDDEVKNGLNFYYIKAYQHDGNRIWSSPIFVNYIEKTL